MTSQSSCLCNKVEALAVALGQLDAAGHGGSALAVVLRMKLAALLTELIADDLIERARLASMPVNTSDI